MTKTKVFWAAAAVVAFAAMPARAALIDVTWTGTVSSGDVDAAGAFGVQDTFAGNELAGLSFTASYRFDTTIGSLVSGTGFANLRGGTSFGAASPLVSASLTINGVTVSFAGSLFTGYSRENNGTDRSTVYTEIELTNPGGAEDELFLNYFRPDATIAFTGLDESQTIAIVTGTGVIIQGIFQAFDDTTGLRQFAGNLTPTQVTIAPFIDQGGGGDGGGGGGGGDVPEPASLALLGLGLAGLALERRRRRAG